MEVVAARIQGSRIFSLTKLFRPDRMVFDNEKVVVTVGRYFGLGHASTDVRLNIVASVHLSAGIFNASILVETHGRTTNVGINYVPKKEAEAFVRALRETLSGGATRVLAT